MQAAGASHAEAVLGDPLTGDWQQFPLRGQADALNERITAAFQRLPRRLIGLPPAPVVAALLAGYPFLRRSWLPEVPGGPLKETALTDQKISPRFVFLDQALETTQVGPDSFIDAYPTAAKPQFEAAKSGNTVRIQLTGQDAGYQSALDWPSPGSPPVEIGPALLEILERADRDESSKKTRDLAEQIRTFFDRTDR
jgi:hypothetical protein